MPSGAKYAGLYAKRDGSTSATASTIAWNLGEGGLAMKCSAKDPLV